MTKCRRPIVDLFDSLLPTPLSRRSNLRQVRSRYKHRYSARYILCPYCSLSLENHVRIKLSNQQTRYQLQKRCLTSSQQQQQQHPQLAPFHFPPVPPSIAISFLSYFRYLWLAAESCSCAASNGKSIQ